jgi:hypothetical protein
MIDASIPTVEDRWVAMSRYTRPKLPPGKSSTCVVEN